MILAGNEQLAANHLASTFCHKLRTSVSLSLAATTSWAASFFWLVGGATNPKLQAAQRLQNRRAVIWGYLLIEMDRHFTIL
jgi:hypothetical protein